MEAAGTLAFAALLIWLVWRHTDSSRLVAAFQEIDWCYYAAAVVGLFGYQIFRALRTQRLIDAHLGFSRLLETVCLLSAVNTFLPAGVGDLGMVYLLRRRHGVEIHLGAATFVMATIADITVFFVLFAVLAIVAAKTIPPHLYAINVGLGAALIIAIVSIAVMGLAATSENLMALSRRSGVLGSVVRFSLSFVKAVQLIRSPRILVPTLVLSAVMWVIHYLIWLFILRALGLDLSAVSVLWVYLLFFVSTFLPVRGVAAMGPRIAIWFFVLQVVGIEESRAATAALSTDILLQTLSLWAGAVPLVGVLVRSLQRGCCRMQGTCSMRGESL
jgi:uncharacterized protein (TIRG00374 family)